MRQIGCSSKPGKKKAAGIALIIIGAGFLAYFGVWATDSVIHWSFDMGVRFILACGVLLTASGVLLLHGGIVPWLRKHRLIRGALVTAAALFLLSFAAIEGLVLHGAARNDKAVKTDYVLILGATVVEGRPSLALKHRLDGALPYIQANPGATVIVSGAKGEDEDYSEAEVMKDYLVQKGVDGRRVVEEDQATNTIENIAYSREIMDRLKAARNPKVMLVTNDFHMFRTMLLARAQGLDACGISVPIHWSVAPICYCREYFSVMKLLLTGLRQE